MAEIVNELSGEDFGEFIAKGNCIVDFFADWCMPCKEMMPVFEKAAKSLKDKVKFGKINIEGNEEIAQKYLVMSIPALLFFKNGKEANKVNGLVSEEEIIKTAKATFK